MIRRILRRVRDAKTAMMTYAAKSYLGAKGVSFGKRLQIWSFPYCRCCEGGSIAIGDDVIIRNKINENEAGCFQRSVLVALPGARLTIGNNVGISSAVIYCSTEIIIEDHVGIGAGVRIYDTDFHPILAVDRRRHDESRTRKAPVRICTDAWIGANAMILKGVTIGARSVVGAGSVVTKDVPPDMIVAGSPAKVIRRIDNPESEVALSVLAKLES